MRRFPSEFLYANLIFRFFRADNPSFRNLNQYSSIRFRSVARHAPAFIGVFTKFLGVGSPNIPIPSHFEFRIMNSR
jgi:hypothetical protein